MGHLCVGYHHVSHRRPPMRAPCRLAYASLVRTTAVAGARVPHGGMPMVCAQFGAGGSVGANGGWLHVCVWHTGRGWGAAAAGLLRYTIRGRVRRRHSALTQTRLVYTCTPSPLPLAKNVDGMGRKHKFLTLARAPPRALLSGGVTASVSVVSVVRVVLVRLLPFCRSGVGLAVCVCVLKLRGPDPGPALRW